MKKTILAVTLALTLACGSFLGFLPGKGAMTVKAAEAGAAAGSSVDAKAQLVTPTDTHWICVNVGEVPLHASGTVYGSAFTIFKGEVGVQYEVEFYLNGELCGTELFSVEKTREDGYISCMSPKAGIRGWSYIDSTGELMQDVLYCKYKEEGKYTYRVRAVSDDGNSYSEWSEMSGECDNTRTAWLAVYGPDDGADNSGDEDSDSSDGNGSNSDDSNTIDSGDNETEAENDNTGGTVTTSSGEALTSSAAVNVSGATPAVVRTPQGTVTAAAAAAVGGLREGQYVMANVGGSACGELARQAVTNAASSVGGRVASYLEITLDVYNREGGVEQTVTQLSTPIEFTVAAPAELDGNQYDFAVVRLHGDGKVDILPDLDNDPATITFRTDRFSVYAVIYGAKGAFKTSGGKDSVPKTGDSTIPVLPFAAAGAACTVAAVILKRRVKA